jgi:hypothetical protein
MIDAKELRIGNWLQNNGIRFSVTGENIEQFSRGVNHPLQNIQPVPLSSELLEQCGFETTDGGREYSHPNDPSGVFIREGVKVKEYERIALRKFTEGYFIETYYSGIEIKHLHQLQNFYFAHTGTELEISINQTS